MRYFNRFHLALLVFVIVSIAHQTVRSNPPDQVKYHVTRRTVHGKAQVTSLNGTVMLCRVVHISQPAIDKAMARMRIRNDQPVRLTLRITATVNGVVAANEKYSTAGPTWQPMTTPVRVTFQKSPTTNVVFSVVGTLESKPGADDGRLMKKQLHQVNGVDLSGDEMDAEMELESDDLIK